MHLLCEQGKKHTTACINQNTILLRLFLVFRFKRLLKEYCSDSLRAARSGDRIPVEARFSARVQTDPGAPQPPIQWVPGDSRE